MRVWRTISLLYFGTYTIIILQFLQGIVLTGPVIKRSIRMVREVYPEIETDKHEGNQAEVCIVGDVVYGADEPVPSDQPCLKCKCQPPGVQCEAIQCSQKQGCKAIHKPNQCCPEYQCECIHNGTVYGNGERLATLPGGECSVCYCRGGEVQCANVSCYKRADCEGRTVPGQCCPKYDHCPLKEPSIERLNSRIPLTTASGATEKGSLTTAIYDVHELIRENNKISDIHSTIGQSPTDASAAIRISNPQSINADLQPENIKSVPHIIIQEIIPERKEIPITTAPKQNINLLVPKTQTTFIDTNFNNSDKQETDLVITDTESESSEISEIYHQPPPVLKIGDKLLIFKKGELVAGKDISTPVPVITIIGAEGLQRGTEDSSEFHEISSQLQGPQKDIGNFDDLLENETLSAKPVVTEKETHIISFVKQKKVKGSITPEPTTEFSTTQSEFEEVLFEDINRNEGDVNQTPFLPNNYVTYNTDAVQSQTKSVLNNDFSNITEVVETIEESEIINEEKNLSLNINTEQKKITESEVNKTMEPEFQDVNKFDLKTNITDTMINSPIPVDDASSTMNNANKTKTYYSAHILINPNATLPPSLLKQPALSDILDDDFEELENKVSNETLVLLPDYSNVPREEVLDEQNNTTSIKEMLQGNLEDSGESTTIPNNQTSEITSFENASIETVQNDTHALNTTDMVEILPGFQITTENNKHKVSTFEEDSEIIDTKQFVTTAKPIVDIIKPNTTDEEIFRQLNKELNTFSSLNFTALKNTDEGAEAIFKELLEEVTSSTLPPHATNDESSLHQLHEKEAQLLQKVSEAISKFQSKESKEALDARIMGILKDFFNAQHKVNNNTTESTPLLPTVV